MEHHAEYSYEILNRTMQGIITGPEEAIHNWSGQT